MKKLFTILTLGAATLIPAQAQTAWDKTDGFTDDLSQLAEPNGNNLLQGAEYSDFIAGDNWSPLSGGPFSNYTGTQFSTGDITYTVPQGRGNAQWTAQLRLKSDYTISAGKNYDFCFVVNSTAANKLTVKIEDPTDTDKRTMGYAYVTLPANKKVAYVLKNVSPALDIRTAELVFDLGGAEVGSEVKITNIILQGHDALEEPAAPKHLDKAPEGYVMVWNDEFDDPSTLLTKWNHMDWKAGNVNDELQTYKPGNLAIEAADGTMRHTSEIADGKLTINCFKGKDGKIYSGRMDTHDANGVHSGYAAWRYGYMEARIKLPSGKGTWPAFWMMPEGVNWTDETWPTCGEIDIMEEVGYSPDNCVCSLHALGHYHANNTQVSASKHVDGMEGGWVTYALLWDNENIAMYANGERILSYANDHNGYVNWPYDRPYYITLNLAWGGGWGGAQGVDESKLPVGMEVDYVRVYQLPAPEMAEDGSGAAYIQGAFNAIAKDGIVPSSTFSNWNDNFIPLAEDGKVYTKEFTVGKNLHPGRVDFALSAAAKFGDDKVFTPSGSKYKVTLDESDVFQMNPEGHVSLRPGMYIADGATVTVTLDCTRGTGDARLTVVASEAGEKEPVEKPEGIWIIGADQSVVPGLIDGGSWNWSEANAIRMTDNGNDTYSYEFVLGETLSRNVINFKFFCQAGFTNAEGKEVAFTDHDSDYHISSASDYLGIGNGSTADNGNVYKKQSFPADVKNVTVTVDCSKGYDAAVLYTSLDKSGIEDALAPELPADDRWYDLSGRVIPEPTAPGFYIHNRRKVVIR